jgi:hypothetical protein
MDFENRQFWLFRIEELIDAKISRVRGMNCGKENN